MLVKRIFNNNILLAHDQQNEYVLLGRGISFGKKAGDLVNTALIEKQFVLDNTDVANHFMQLMNGIPINIISLVERIIDQAQKDLNIQFDDNLFLGLTDHIHFAIKRHREGGFFQNVLLWEIKKFYAKEFEAATKSLDLIEYYEGILLPEDEAAFIALHFANYKYEHEDMQSTLQITQVLHDVTQIARYELHIDLDEDGVDYYRFITHIRIFTSRILNDEMLSDDDIPLYLYAKQHYPKAFSCASKILEYYKKKFQVEPTKEELIYLALHINNLIKRGARKKN